MATNFRTIRLQILRPHSGRLETVSKSPRATTRLKISEYSQNLKMSSQLSKQPDTLNRSGQAKFRGIYPEGGDVVRQGGQGGGKGGPLASFLGAVMCGWWTKKQLSVSRSWAKARSLLQYGGSVLFRTQSDHALKRNTSEFGIFKYSTRTAGLFGCFVN